MAKPDSPQQEDSPATTGARALRMIAFHPDRSAALRVAGNSQNLVRILERTVIEEQRHGHHPDTPIVCYKHTRIEERWHSAQVRPPADAAAGPANPVKTPQTASQWRGNLRPRQRALLLRYGVWAASALALCLTALMMARTARKPVPATKPPRQSVTVMLEESATVPVKAAATRAPAAKTARIALAPPATYAAATGATASGAEHVSDPAPLMASSNADMAVASAVETGRIEPWREDSREGFVIAGGGRKQGALNCREVTVVVKGGAQGDAVTEWKCVNAKGQISGP